MKTLWHAIAILAMAHVLAALLFVGWLIATQRLNRERLAQMTDLLKTPVPQVESENQQSKHDRKMTDAGKRPGEKTAVSSAERLAVEARRGRMMLRRLEQAREQLESLRRNLELARESLNKKMQALQAKKQALQKRLAKIEQKLNSQGFEKAVAMYESLPADQVKRMFLEMMNQGRIEQVVRYLGAMQPRAAADVLEEFQTPGEIARAVELTKRLRQRGSELREEVQEQG